MIRIDRSLMEGDEIWLSVMCEDTNSEIAQFHFNVADPLVDHNHKQLAELLYAIIGSSQDVTKLSIPAP